MYISAGQLLLQTNSHTRNIYALPLRNNFTTKQTTKSYYIVQYTLHKKCWFVIIVVVDFFIVYSRHFFFRDTKRVRMPNANTLMSKTEAEKIQRKSMPRCIRCYELYFIVDIFDEYIADKQYQISHHFE